jgi:hypothetical protein
MTGRAIPQFEGGSIGLTAQPELPDPKGILKFSGHLSRKKLERREGLLVRLEP